MAYERSDHDDVGKVGPRRTQIPSLSRSAARKIDDERLHSQRVPTIFNSLLEDEFPATPPLRPADSYGRAQMRVWTKWVDEYFCWCVSTIGWHRMVGGMVRHLGDEEFEKMVARIPLKEQQVKWRRARAGFPQEILDEEMRKIAYSVKTLEARLAMSPWLAGEQYTLADVCNFAIANGTQNSFADLVNEKDTPHLVAWIHRINERPACKLMFAKQPSEWANRRRE